MRYPVLVHASGSTPLIQQIHVVDSLHKEIGDVVVSVMDDKLSIEVRRIDEATTGPVEVTVK